MIPRRVKIASLIALPLVAALVFAPFVIAQSDDSQQYFRETGHTVRGPFLEYFYTTGALKRYGYPITEEYVDPQTGLVVQYFQRARMEWHPGNPDPYKVQLGLLADELGKREPPVSVRQVSSLDPNCQYFPETSHTLCLKFLDYWRSTGGLDAYGYPITEHMIENGLIVQYFQRAKMEWHPGKTEGQRIQLALLGEIYCDNPGLICLRRGPEPISASIRPVSLNARASVLNPYVPPGGYQTGFVYVSDQLGNPLRGAAVTLVAHYPAGPQSFTLPPTNSSGATFIGFVVGEAKPGALVPLEFIIYYNTLVTHTRTSYMMWYY